MGEPYVEIAMSSAIGTLSAKSLCLNAFCWSEVDAVVKEDNALPFVTARLEYGLPSRYNQQDDVRQEDERLICRREYLDNVKQRIREIHQRNLPFTW